MSYQPFDAVKKALFFAEDAHKGQKRKYTGENYIVHPIAVSKIVASVTSDPAMIAAALLHDVVEDTSINLSEIQDEFGPEIANLVDWLTDISCPSDGNRKARKALDRERLSHAPADAQTIKLADLIDNSDSIIKHDPNFAVIYMKEKTKLLEVLTKGDSTLFKKAKNIIFTYYSIVSKV